MKKLSVLLMLIALMACVACQRQQTEERKNSETQREMQERAAAEHSAEAQQRVTQGDPNARENASEMLPEPGSSASSGTSPEKRNTFDTANQKTDRKEAVQGGKGPSRLLAPTEETSPVQAQVPQPILEAILNKAAELAKVGREQLVMVRAESAIWNAKSRPYC